MTMFRAQQNAFDDAVGESCGVFEDLWLLRRADLTAELRRGTT